MEASWIAEGAVSGERYGYLKVRSQELNDVFGNTATLQIITESGKAEEIKQRQVA